MKSLVFNTIGAKIRETRLTKKLTQETLASIVDVNISHISNIENNNVKVSLTLLVSIANALDTTVDYLLGNEYNQKDSASNNELFHVISNMDSSKKETLLRIAKVL